MAREYRADLARSRRYGASRRSRAAHRSRCSIRSNFSTSPMADQPRMASRAFGLNVISAPGRWRGNCHPGELATALSKLSLKREQRWHDESGFQAVWRRQRKVAQVRCQSVARFDNERLSKIPRKRLTPNSPENSIALSCCGASVRPLSFCMERLRIGSRHG